jgi:hypothetical protein
MILDNEIEPIRTIQADGFVHDRNAHLPCERDSSLLELMTEAFLVRRLE